MEEEQTYPEEMLQFFKALADANRLKIVGLLAKEPLNVEEIAGRLGLSSSTVSHHLARLAKAGLVSARPAGYYTIYRLETKALEDLAKRLLATENLPRAADEIDVDAYDRKVLTNYMTPGGRLKDFPVQQKKLEAVLRYAVRLFEPGVRYPEKQVNEILQQFTEDTARMRRNLVEVKLMAREGGGGAYWRIDG